MSGPVPLVTIKLGLNGSIQTPDGGVISNNFISDWNKPLPPFVTQFDKELLRKRSPPSDVGLAVPSSPVLLITSQFQVNLMYLELVKSFLTDNYGSYFTHTSNDSEPNNPGSITNPTSPLEFVQYSGIFFDRQLSSSVIYSANKESHVFSLLRQLISTCDNNRGLACQLCVTPNFRLI